MKKVVKQYPKVIVGALVFNKDKLLLLKSHKWHSEAQEYVWASLNQALKLPVNSYTRRAIEDCFYNFKIKRKE